jgi:hypothetical protein
VPKAAEFKGEDKLVEAKLLTKHASAWLLLGTFLIVTGSTGASIIRFRTPSQAPVRIL